MGCPYFNFILYTMKIKELIKRYPNDADLGKAIRDGEYHEATTRRHRKDCVYASRNPKYHWQFRCNNLLNKYVVCNGVNCNYFQSE